MTKLSQLALAVLGLALFCIASAGPRVFVSSEAGLKLSEQEEIEVLEAPTKLIAQPPEHLQQAFQSGAREVVISDIPEHKGASFRYMAIVRYSPIVQSDTRLIEPVVVCEGDGTKPQWVRCHDNSDIFATLPNHAPISINDISMTDEQVERILAAVDLARLRTASDTPVTSKDVNHILLRSRESGVYAIVAQTPNRETADIDLKRIVTNGDETYELTKWSCR